MSREGILLAWSFVGVVLCEMLVGRWRKNLCARLLLVLMASVGVWVVEKELITIFGLIGNGVCRCV
jgi:hypothetical protein